MTSLRNKLIALSLLTLLIPAIASAYVSEEGFDTNWAPTPPWGSYQNGTNSVTGWIGNSIAITNKLPDPHVAPFAARINADGWVQSPLLTNGAGTLTFYARANTALNTNNIINLESSYDGLTWPITNNTFKPTGNYIAYSNTFNTTSNLYIRLRRTTAATGFPVIDTISISAPPPIISITNITTSPTRPADLDPVIVLAGIGVQGFNDSLWATNSWREWPNTNWTAIPMSTNASGYFESATSITGKPIGSLVEYIINATCVSDGTPYSTNSGIQSYVVRPQSGFTNMLVTGQITTNLLIGANYSWQNVVTLSNAINCTFRFQGHSNGIPTVWGDSNPTASNIPAYGTADVNATNIVLAGTNTGAFVIGFNESSRAYSVMACESINFDSWTSSTFNAFGNYTNDTWIVSGGSTSNDAARAFSGRSLMLNGQQGAATNTYLLSPPLTNGIGQISFWYRNWATNASPTASFSVQVATNPASTNWATVATVTNIISTNYLFYSFSVPQSNRWDQYVQILNNPDGGSSRLCLDEVVIARPGAGVSASITNTPANPLASDTVVISATITPLSGAITTNMIIWYRMGTSGNFISDAMTNTSGTVWESPPIPPSAPGIVQYAIQCFFSGLQSESSSPVWLPSSGTNNPSSYQVTTPTDNRTEGFDTNWAPTPPWLTYQNGTNSVTGWIGNSLQITNFPTPHAGAFAARMNADGWVQSPLLTNGAGTLTVYAKASTAANTNNIINLESSYDGSTWTTNNSFKPISTAYTSFSNTFNTTSNLYIRLRRTTASAGYPVIDTIFVPLPPADVLITNVFINPGYPSASDTVTVSCNISSINPIFPAWGITPTLYYRPANTTSFTPLPMTRTSGTTYSTAPFTIPAQIRDTVIQYYIRCDFYGFYGIPADNHSPRYYPSGGSNAPTFYTVRQFASSFSNVTAVINGQTQPARLLNNRSWQAVASLGATTNSLSISFVGNGYTAGSGYATNPITWGNSNNWQTALPLADTAETNQATVYIDGSFTAGQYLLRIDEASGNYFVIPCVWQDFESWSGDGTTYKLTDNNAAASPLTLSFDDWTVNTARIRTDSFDGAGWATFSTYVNGGVGGDDFYVIYGSKIASSSVQTDPTSLPKGERWVAQVADESPVPFLGIESMKYSYKVQNVGTYTNTTISINLMPTNLPHDSTYFDLANETKWKAVTNHYSVTNTSFYTNTITLQTNGTHNVIFSHDTGTNSVFFDDLTIKEWYSQSVTNAGWIATHAWIESKAFGDNICRLEASRANPFGSDQYLQSPLLTNGIHTLSFAYSAGANSSVTFDVQIAYNTPTSWSNITSIATNVANPGTNYITAEFTLLLPPTNAYLRIKNTTPKPGALLLNSFNISPYVIGASWRANNAAIDIAPPVVRKFYANCGYLNSNRTSNISTDPATKPDTNTYPYVRTPQITGGIGEVSFWYRNWALTGPVPPAKLVVQTCATDSTNNTDWTTIGILNNIVNTNDYLYFRTSVYDTVSQYVRIYNDDTFTNKAGRVCLDDILVTAPFASTLSMSNLVVSPSIPLYTNTVNIMVDVYHLFLNPSNISLQATYGAATDYVGLASAPLTNLTMSCIASNLSAPGKWYRYQTTTPIPTHDIDTFVKYFTKATFDGYHTSGTSPKTNKLFGIYPYWYDPLNAINGTNLAYYIVFSCPTNGVWINEVNYGYPGATDQSNEYVEICGPEGTSLNNWKIQLLSNPGNVGYGDYPITNGTPLPYSTNGFGFWVLGDSNVPNRNLVFTNATSGSRHLYNPGAIRLIRSNRTYAQQLCYGTAGQSMTNQGYEFIGYKTSSTKASSPLFLQGTGTVYGAFTWTYLLTTGSHTTPGLINENQAFPYTGLIYNPDFYILRFWLDTTNVWIHCNTTNNWYPVPYYTTNLMMTNAWPSVPVFNSSIVSTNCTINFTKPTNSTTYFYMIEATNSP